MRGTLRRAVLAAAGTVALTAGLGGLALGRAQQQGDRGDGLPDALRMRQIAHNDLGGGKRGAGGEGFSEVAAPGGRRILYMANESGPTCFNVIDVTSAEAPRLLSRIDVPARTTRCNSLDASGNLLVVANQVEKAGQKPAGVQIYDITDREHPRQVGFFDTSGRFSRGVHYVWLADGRFMHISSGMPDFQTRRKDKDDQIYVIVDLQNPSAPREVGRWWMPGTKVGDSAKTPKPNRLDQGCRMHNVEVFPGQPDRAYIGYIDCGVVVLDISDKAHPRVVGRMDDSPPEPGFTHTVMPLDGGRTLAVTHEAVEDFCADFPKLITMVDARNPARMRRMAAAPLPADTADLCERGGRFGAHNIHENYPDELAFRSESLLVGSFFNGGVRVYDIRNRSRPREVGFYVPPAPQGSSIGAIQFNDVYVDDRGVVFAGDRFEGGLYVLRSDAVDQALRAQR
jgi:hypothetical protein